MSECCQQLGGIFKSSKFVLLIFLRSWKQSRQVQLCTKVPPSSRKRIFEGGSSICNAKSGLMKKAKLEFLNSHEVKNLAAMKNKAVHRNYSVPSGKKPSFGSGLAAAACLPKLAKPIQKRF